MLMRWGRGAMTWGREPTCYDKKVNAVYKRGVWIDWGLEACLCGNYGMCGCDELWLLVDCLIGTALSSPHSLL